MVAVNGIKGNGAHMLALGSCEVKGYVVQVCESLPATLPFVLLLC